MSHCPYGTQIEKGMLPVALLLGDKIDFEIKFVYYAMHGETEVLEQLNQYCIQEEQNDLFLDYMTCFLEAGDGEGCLESIGVDMDTLENCSEVADEEFSITANLDDTSSYLSGKFPMFNIHKTENDNYGVRGSPTLVINGEQVSAGRDSISLLSAVCGAFNEAPEECDTELEVGTPGPGFGWDSSGSSNVAACGG
jgi:glutaredoxin